MAPSSVILIRHGEAIHNVFGGRDYLRDPGLTRVGKQQCLYLRRDLEQLNIHPDIILVSPNLRALTTALLSTRGLVDSANMPSRVMIWPELQETSDLPCGTPRDLATNWDILSKDLEIDCASSNRWKKVRQNPASEEDWLYKRGLFRPKRAFIRADYVRRCLQELDGQVVVISHGTFTRLLLGLDYNLESPVRLNPLYNNCEAREYNMVDGKFVNERVIHEGTFWPEVDQIDSVPAPISIPLPTSSKTRAQPRLVMPIPQKASEVVVSKQFQEEDKRAQGESRPCLSGVTFSRTDM